MNEVRASHSPGPYEIRVQGRLEARWAAWFDGCTLTWAGDGTTVIAVNVVDQAALHGLLQAVGDLGLPLLSVTQTGTGAGLAPAAEQRRSPAASDTRQTAPVSNPSPTPHTRSAP